MGYFFSFTQIIVWVNVWSYLARFGARGFLDVHHRNKPMNTIVLVVRIVLLSLTLAFVGAFAALATGTAAPAVESAYEFVLDVLNPFTCTDGLINKVNVQWLDTDERVKMGDTNLIDGAISNLMVHQANVEGTVVYEIVFQLCDLADNLHYISQDLYTYQFILMGWFGL
jgi:hypothetical protein